MPGIATGVVSYLGDICGTRGDIQDTAQVDVLFKTLYISAAVRLCTTMHHWYISLLALLLFLD